MNLRIKHSTTASRLMDTEELRAYTGLERNSAMMFVEEIGAKVKVESGHFETGRRSTNTWMS